MHDVTGRDGIGHSGIVGRPGAAARSSARAPTTAAAAVGARYTTPSNMAKIPSMSARTRPPIMANATLVESLIAAA